MIRSGLLLAGCAGLALAAPAIAQPAAAGAEARGLQDIIVTAQRRAESLQDVPISITAADSRVLAEARVENISNIQAISPSVSFRVTNIATSSANVVIRGLGTTGNSRSFEGSVGIFIDGVYRTRAAAALQNFLDIDNLQILRGPQGTLFGKNTTAGAILLSSATPDVHEFGGFVDLGYGNYNSITAKAAANVPLGDVAAIRIAGLTSHTDGFYRDATSGNRLNDDSTRAVKAQLLFEPSDAVSIRLIGDYSKGAGNCCYATADYIDGPTQPLVDALTQAWGGVVPPRDGKLHFEQTLNGNGHQVVKDYGGTLLMDFDFGNSSLHSVTSVRKFSLNQTDMDPDFSGADIFRYYESFSSRFISQELTFNNHIDALNADAVLGAFFSDEKLNMGRTLPWAAQGQAYWDAVFAAQGVPPGTVYAAPGAWAVEDMGGKARSYAAFAHIDARLSEQFSVIAGVRYSIEKKRGWFSNPFYRSQPNDVFRVLGIQPGPAYDATTTDKALSGTFGLQFRPTQDVMLYATYNRGFKAGGVNMDANAPASSPTTRPKCPARCR